MSRARRLLPPALVAGGLAAAALALHVRDPHQEGSWGLCPTAAMGFACPGCGGLRAVNLLGNADVAGAASSNLVLVLALPFIAYAYVQWTAGRWRGRSWEPSARALGFSAVATVAVLVVFTVLRNLPAGSWLAP